MGQKMKSISLAALMLLSTLSVILIAAPAAATQVVITEAIQIVDSGSANDRMAAVAADSEGNVHVIWSRSTQHLYYSMVSPRGEVLIDATQITSSGLHKIFHPDMVIDELDNVHIVWADHSGQHKIMYTALAPFNTAMDGNPSDDGSLTIIDDTIVAQQSNNRDWPAIDVDSKGNVHIVWEDNYDSLDLFFQQPQIYYSMIHPDYDQQSAIVLFDDTLLTPIIGHKGHPDIVVDSDDYVQIAWDDTRGGKVELVFVVDTSGSMYSEWADVCTVIYGGAFQSGGNFKGIKPMLEEGNMTVYETIYGLGNTLPGAANSGNCASHNQNSGPRSTPLGQVPNDDSGGLRTLPGTIYSGSTYSGYSGEDWGPGSNWACLSWKDSNGNVGYAANPPTTSDHRWNPNATKIVLPVSDEGPKDGDPSQQADDTQSINEAHDNCVNAGVIPVGLYGQSWGGANNIQSHMKDLVQCPNGVISTATRNCPGSTQRSTDAGGQAYEFPSGTAGASQMQLLVEAMVYISTNNSREIFMTVLDPYGKMDNDDNWVSGAPGHVANGNSYTEDLGRGSEGHLVVVNDTRVTIDDAFSLHPSIGVDNMGNTHIAWMDGRDYGFEKNVPYEIYYTKLRLQGAGEWDGVPNGLSTYAMKRVEDTPISTVEGWGGNVAGTSQHSAYPALLTDDQNNIHIAWLDFANVSTGQEVLYTRLNSTDLTGPGNTSLDPWNSSSITPWESYKLGPNQFSKPSFGQPPAFANDLGSGAHVAWSDTNKCGEESNNGRWTICYSHVLTGQVDIEFETGETYYHVIEPGEQTIYNLTINNTTPGPKDLVADTYNLNITGMPENWTANLYFANNHTSIFADTPIFLEGGEMARIYLRVRAPSIYQANEDQLAEIIVSATSNKDPAIRSDRVTLTLMDVVHGIDLDTSHRMADVEQGQTAIFSITITNTGNVHDSFAFYDPNSLEGQQEWLLPFGWQIDFPLQVSLDPGQSITKNLEVSVPTSQDPNTFVIYVKGWSEGEPLKSIEKGTYDVLELWVNVSIRSIGNIVFEIYDTSEIILPGDCAEYDINVLKNYEPGYLKFTTPGSPEAKPDEVDLNTWRQDHWTLDLDFSNAPSARDIDDPTSPRLWPIETTYTVVASICAPYNANAGLGPAVTVKANLEGYARVADSVILSTNVIHVFSLDTQTETTDISANPGDSWIIPTTVVNTGNGPDRYDLRLGRVYDEAGIDVLWDVDVPRSILTELGRDTSQTVDITINVPNQVPAGIYTVVLQSFSEEDYPDATGHRTRLRGEISLIVTVNEFYDMQISMDPMYDNAVKTTAPGRIVEFMVSITNGGNVVDTPSLHNHTSSKDGSTGEVIWNTLPGMGALSGWSVEWKMVNFVGSDLKVETECVDMLSTAEEFPEDVCVRLTDIGEWRLPEMDPYTTHMMIATIHVSTEAKLDTRYIGLKVTSQAGGMLDEGDHDDSPEWVGELLDSNELILTLRLRAPNLVISEVSVSETNAEVGSTLPVRVVLQNTGNVHASNIDLVLCQFSDFDDEMRKELRKEGCPDESIVARRTIGALLAPDASEESKQIEIYLLYPVSAGSYDVVVFVDPTNEIVEVSESDNIRVVGEELSSNSPLLDVAGQIVSDWALPFGVLVLTFSLFGVLYAVGSGRRAEVKNRIAEQSSLISVLSDDDA
ncbi:MAG: CARDB domain-containing protein [Candidatus Poseidoniales archaeon]